MLSSKREILEGGPRMEKRREAGCQSNKRKKVNRASERPIIKERNEEKGKGGGGS